MVGEMRDSETMAAALTKAETGHLVLSSLHTNDAAQTVSRILDTFPPDTSRRYVSNSPWLLLKDHLPAVTPGSQWRRTPPSRGNSRPPPAQRNLIRRGDSTRANIETGRADGMLTMEQSLVELVRAGRISRETAFAHCYHPDDLRRHLES